VTFAPRIRSIEIVHARLADVSAEPSLLSDPERARLARLSSRAAATFGASRTFARRVLGRALGISALDVIIDSDEDSKPRVPADHDLDFSVTHGGDWIAIAVARGCKIGIDIEPIEDSRDWSAISGALGMTIESAHAWARLEARCKATGRGLTIPIDLDLERGDGLESRDLTSFPDHAAAVAWTLA